ncbi:MAG: ribosome hibernation-promoting factor, HPF/YfiA family [Candidatus Omnitrophota bacterium]
MSINFTSKNVKMTGALKGYVEKSLATIEKISGEIIDAEIISSEEKLLVRVEINLKTKTNKYNVEAKDPLLKQALRSALNNLKTQAKKNKEKQKEDKKRGSKEKDIFRRGAVTPEPVEAEPRENPISNITVSYNYSKKPVSVEEAFFFFRDSGENAYMFTNIETNKLSVLFYDENKNVSIIEAQ